MSSNTKLQKAVRLALGISAGTLAFGVSPGALAQDDDADELLEEIVTTGSRIKRAALDSASPITVIRREDILSTGITDVGDLIQRMPSMSGSPIGTTTNNGGNGSVTIDLRGMGVDRTVTLVNGKGTVEGGDCQTIPGTMIDRVEVLKDSGSAIYGADAVAGVVNIITRRDFEGIEVSAQFGDFIDMDDGDQVSVALIAGTSFGGSGSFVFGAEYIDQSQAFQADAPWQFFQESNYIYPEGCEAQVTAPYDGTPTGGCFKIGSSRIPETRIEFLTQGRFLIGTPASAPNQVGLMIPHDGRTYNYAPVNYIQTPYKRTNLFAEAHFELTDTVRFNAEIRGNFRESAQELAPMPYNSPTDPAFDGTFGGVAYSGISEDNYYLQQAVTAYNLANGTALIFEPVRDARRRMIETTRRFTQDINQHQFVAGLEGTFRELDWEIYYNRGFRSRVDNDFGQFSGPRLSNALGPSADLLDATGQPGQDGIPECYQDITDPSTIIAGCVSLNMFGGGAVTAAGIPTTTSLTQDMIDYLAIDLTDTFVDEMEIWGASVSGSIFDLPGGELGWAAGYAYWGQSLRFQPDSAKQIDAVTGNVGAGTEGALYSNSIFGEVLAPVYDNGEQSLTLTAGVRFDDYNRFDSETTWQAGVEFQVIDSLKLRATAGTVFRTPTLDDLFGGQVDNFPTFSDPCAAGGSANCGFIAPQFDTQVLARVGGNILLNPETGDTITAGVVWTPEFGDHDLSITLDYWQIELDDGISSLGVQFILEDCYERGNQASCDLITRRPDFTIAQIIDGSLNVAEQGAEGIDIEIRYSIDTDIGQWEAALLWSHLLERTKTPFQGAAEEDLSGRHTDPTAEDGGAYADDKINYSIGWSRGNFAVSYLGEFISSLDADTFCNCGAGNRPDGSYIQDIDSELYHDLYFAYEVPASGTRISAGVTNFTDEEPPFIDTGFNATTDPSTYRLFGIGYFLRVTQSFE